MSQHRIFSVISIQSICLSIFFFFLLQFFFSLRCSSLTTTIYQVNNCVVISVRLFTSWTVRLYVHLILRFVFGCLWQSCRFVFIPLVLFIHYTFLSFIQCRVQLMITDQTVAINMKVRKRFFTLLSSFFLTLHSRIILIFLFSVALAVKSESMKMANSSSEDGKWNVAKKSWP